MRPVCTLARRREGRGDLGGVMGVVVHHAHAGDLSLELEAALDADEARQRFRHRVEGDVELQGDRDRGEGVLHVVATRQCRCSRVPSGSPRCRTRKRMPPACASTSEATKSAWEAKP